MSGGKLTNNPSRENSKFGSQGSSRAMHRPHRLSPRTGDDSRPECQAIKDNGLICGETKTLSITDELKELYENRLRKLDEDIGKDAAGDSCQVQLKVNVLQSWVQDLLEQNAELVHTVEELEQEMGYRVKLLEEKLVESARACREYMTKLHDFDAEMHDSAANKGKEKHSKCQVGNLKSDISNLLKLICRAREKGIWSTDGLNFCEVAPEDIFPCLPLPCPSRDIKGDPCKPNRFGDNVCFHIQRSVTPCTVTPEGTVPPGVVQSANAVSPVSKSVPDVTVAPVSSVATVATLPPKTPRKVKLSLELALNRINTRSSSSYADATNQNPLTYQWSFEPPNEPCRCNPQL